MIKRVLFVCYGNACRSPMAELLFESMVSEDRSLQSAGIEVESAGLNAALDAATPEAIAVMAEYGLNLNGHQPETINSSLADWADLVLVMEVVNKRDVVTLFPWAEEKVHLLSDYVGDSGEVHDPYRRGIEVYRQCAASLQSLLSKLVEKLKRQSGRLPGLNPQD
jgi:protein-tyrosine phosphatase